MATFVRTALSFLLPGGILFASALFAIQHPVVSPWLPSLERTYPPVLFAVALLLGWRFDRSRLVFAAVVIGLATWLLERYGSRPDALGRIVFDAVALLLPLNIALLAVLKERGIFTWHGLLRWAVILAQPLAVWALFHYRRYDWLGLLDATPVSIPWLDGIGIEQPALLAFSSALLLTSYLGMRRHNAMENGFFWALALLLYALLSGQSPTATTVLFATALLILIVAVVEISYSMAFKDELTGLPGRRALNQSLLKLGSRYTIAMLDVDHFKKFNDRFGHDVGDEVLKMVGAKMTQVTGGGKPFRYGGEEFTVLFPGKYVEDTLPHLEQLRESIANSGFKVRGRKRPRKKPSTPRKSYGQAVKITISIGVAERNGERRKPQQVIKAADKALYRAKEAGRNQVSS